MPILIYVKATGVIGGRTDNVERIEQEIFDLCRSELGGVPDDYAFVDAPDHKPGQIWEIQGGQAVLIPDPAVVAKSEAKTRAYEKLSGLGLTLEEIEAL